VNAPELERVAPSPARRWLRALLVVLSLGFVGWTFWDLARHWDGRMPEIRIAWLIAACPPIAIGVLIQALAWTVLLRRMTGQPIPMRPAVTLHVDSMLARYTPGKVGLPIVRMAGADAVGVTARTVLV